MHGDVFRAPRALELLAALVGTGVQLALLVLSVILITIAGARSRPPARAAAAILAVLGRALLTALPRAHPSSKATASLSRASWSARACLCLQPAHQTAAPAPPAKDCAINDPGAWGGMRRHAVHGARHHRDRLHRVLRAHILCRRLHQVRALPLPAGPHGSRAVCAARLPAHLRWAPLYE